MPVNPPWSRDELILALELYFRIHRVANRRAEIAELSRTLNALSSHEAHPDPGRFRNPNGVGMKLANFAAIDPEHEGISLRRGGRADREVWAEFTSDREALAREAARIRARVSLETSLDGVPVEVQDARELAEERAGKVRRSGQGFRLSAEARRAIEMHAMAVATDYYHGDGWRVEDVSVYRSYDLHCTRVNGEELRVEVKGTTSDGSAVLLTPNEVVHARAHYPGVALFIVANIKLLEGSNSQLIAEAGQAIILQPWRVEDEALHPLGFEYSVPATAMSEVADHSIMQRRSTIHAARRPRQSADSSLSIEIQDAVYYGDIGTPHEHA